MNFAELWPLLVILAISGLVAGFDAGLVVVGGGIGPVPVHDNTLGYPGVPE